MYHPTRGGVRGGKDQFTWESVKTDKDRECYLGHSVMAPVGRWQEGKDITWYAKENATANGQNKEFLKAKEVEEQALMAALGYRVIKKEPITEEIKVKKEKEHFEEKNPKPKYPDIKIEAKGPQSFEFDDKKALDKILLKLLNKYGKDELFEALGGKDRHKSKRSKSKKSKSKNRENSDQDSDSSNDSRHSNRKRKMSKEKHQDKHKSKSKTKKSRKESSTSASSTESDSDSN